jgi:hypothetical protein
MIECLISSTDKTTPFNKIMPFVKARSSEIFIDRVYLELSEGVNWSDCVLPNIAHNIVDSFGREHINWIWRHPVL